ncbi:DNA polymerase III subunit gamma/tau [Anaerococcus degeneri]|uniref:DNA-directed DNA polymerase n=1 Tax=Anaerococcus degeneri TaxID=361500 RepID=A0ABS7Z081_9FIRM|nr:DNA polymerase III subunit gamma/tau [Anaerococcus degeneri]MBP2014952.1 DNA polymerase-3 subunit gamma/tau [Anaerococcus degeneri]MCA2097160.1 DNA polymerase III subunit gamma/tau [Anaerococcus degeneri]
MAKALYRQYRPKVFDQVLGQDKVVNVLKNQIKNKNFSHAYLFSGERGCGKTSAAKIFAKAINCLNPQDGSPCLECENCRAIEEETSLDVVEMDAASNRRIDDIRNLRDNVIYPPANLKYKVYIIDEAHMITREAFNALLKIMEEPPKHLVFILATTEIDKIPKTILSRVQKFEFNKIDSSKIREQINIILNDQNIKMENEAIDLIIRKAKGAMRDALSILDQVLSFDKEEYLLKDVEFILGSVDFEKVNKLVTSIIAQDQRESLKYLEVIRDDGKSNLDIVDSLINFYRDLMVLKVSEDESSFENKERLELLKDKIEDISLERILTSLDVLNDYFIKINSSSNTDILSEVMVLRLIDTVDMNSLISRVEKLERMGQSDIVDTINRIIDNRLENFTPIVNTQNQLPIKKEMEIENSIENNSEQFSPNEELDQSIANEIKEEKENIPEPTMLDPKTVHSIRDMVVSTSGTMLNTLFKDEGFNYEYIEDDFILIIKDEFYRIFIETKVDEIGEKLSGILKKDINFSLVTGDIKKTEKPEFNKKTTDIINKLKNIFADELIIK